MMVGQTVEGGRVRTKMKGKKSILLDSAEHHGYEITPNESLAGTVSPTANANANHTQPIMINHHSCHCRFPEYQRRTDLVNAASSQPRLLQMISQTDTT